MVNLSPPLRGPRFNIIDQTIRERFAGNLALIVNTRPRSDLSVACVPEGRIVRASEDALVTKCQ